MTAASSRAAGCVRAGAAATSGLPPQERGVARGKQLATVACDPHAAIASVVADDIFASLLLGQLRRRRLR
ncbi:MAG: hypothetical protein WAK34_15785 [Rhodoplanes sp.]